MSDKELLDKIISLTEDVVKLKMENERLKVELKHEKELKSILDFKAKDWYVSEADGKIRDMTYNNANNSKQKFKVGDWIVHHGTKNIYQVVAVIDNKYKLKYGDKYQLKYGDNYTIQNCADVDKNARLWDITKDAKDGDVLVDVYGNIGIFQKNDDFDWTSYCSLGCNGGFQNFKVEHENEKTYPATKEQYNILFAKMKEEGYKWDDINKTPKKIEPFNKYEGLNDFERTLADICSGWIGVTLGWKEYIKDNAKVLLKIAVENFNSVQDASFKQELAWNKEDEEMINNIIDYIKPMPIFLISTTGKSGKEYTKEFIKQAITWLKSIKDKYTSILFKLNVVKTINQINNQMK